MFKKKNIKRGKKFRFKHRGPIAIGPKHLSDKSNKKGDAMFNPEEEKNESTFQCSECGEEKPISEQSNDGGVCQDCYNSDSYDK